jgi:hypothetical protein
MHYQGEMTANTSELTIKGLSPTKTDHTAVNELQKHGINFQKTILFKGCSISFLFQ